MYKRQVVHTFEHQDEVNAIALTAKHIASGGDDKKVVVRDVASGEARHTLEHGGPVYAIAMDIGLIASGGDDRKVVVRE